MALVKLLPIMLDKTITNKSSWLGNLKLVYAYHKGQTKVASAYSQAPLKIQRPFSSGTPPKPNNLPS